MLELAQQGVQNLATIHEGIVVTDHDTVVWSPHGQPEAVNYVMHLAQVVLIDSVQEPDLTSAVARARELAEDA